MISFGFPLALLAGAVLAAAALVLHLFAPRPPDRTPLPTARFLRPDPRLLVRPRRIPSDVPVLVLRMALALLLGALFAEPRWVHDREDGTTRVVLLDRGVGMSEAWEGALALALAEAEGGLVVPFDTAVGDPMAAADVAPGSSAADVESSYLMALRAVRRAAIRQTATTRVEAVLVTRPRWGAWDPQLAALRTAAWPGPIRVIDPAPVSAPGNVTAAPPGSAPVAVLPGGGNAAARIALEVLGYRVLDPGDAVPGNVVRFVDATASGLADALAAADGGDTVVVVGATHPARLALLWNEDGWPPAPAEADPPAVLQVGSRRLALDTGVTRARGAARATPGRRLAIAWEDGAPAAAATASGAGCVVRFGGPLDAGAGEGSYPALLRTLADGCRHPSALPPATPLDSAARAVLRGEGSEAVAVASLGDPGGRRLEPWVLLALSLVALVETLVVLALGRSRERRP